MTLADLETKRTGRASSLLLSTLATITTRPRPNDMRSPRNGRPIGPVGLPSNQAVGSATTATAAFTAVNQTLSDPSLTCRG